MELWAAMVAFNDVLAETEPFQVLVLSPFYVVTPPDCIYILIRGLNPNP
jgi:hypothetical protein